MTILFNTSILTWALALVGVLLFASLSSLVSEKAGVVNIAVEGMMIIGALVVSILGTYLTSNDNKSNYTQIPIVLLAGVITAVFALLHAFPAITLKANQIISGTAINILALGLGIFLSTSNWFGKQSQVIASGYSSIDVINITKVVNGKTQQVASMLPIWTIIAIILAIGLFIFFKYTKQGMRYAMVGENPNAIDAAGISVTKYRYLAVILSGFLAGVGGGVFVVTAVSGGGLFSGNMLGYGFLGIAIMIFGQWKISFIVIGSIIFSWLFALGQQIGTLSTNKTIQAISTLFNTLPFVLTILAMVAFSKTSRAPAAVGIPFDKAKR
ncbi:ABC transporter permease [Mycoplasma mycoides]|uniref:ABC transporter permease n=1 Tax=Mycoplasma mycoides TaxID=2102 RepID=UPI00223FDEB7|nr:ABC transporter permease [Mycoplasma mycoides]QVK06015.1 ABC transporter permease [Mycoplasma mycoides subsp. capri]QVK09333.1 ABC transporter permease [Mycoplasma mycoides subsp. capri]